MVFAVGILLVGLMTHERIRLWPRASSSSSSSSPSPPVISGELKEVVASSSSSSSSGVVVGPRLDARGRPCGCVTCTPPLPLPPPAFADDDVYVDMGGEDVWSPYVKMGGGDAAAPSSFAVSDAAVDPVVVADDTDIV